MDDDELKRLRTTLEMVAALVHDGGLLQCNDMTALRRLTLEFWDTSGSVEQRRERVRRAFGESVRRAAI